MADKKKIGIFGGAFNPVHNGHIALAKGFLNFLELDRIIFIPTANPPHKTDRSFASKEDRFNMLSLAIEDCDRFEISDIEFQRQGKSYTYDTLCVLKKMYPDDEFYLIIGADQFLTFDMWYRYKDILSMVNLCTTAREDEAEKAKILDFAKSLEGLDEGRFFLLNQPVIKVSSSEIRDKIKSGEDTSSLICPKVNKYIVEKRLYGV
ncbi:MAG: nicotinate (nicotinamide) nucleotide adenylyltransferase [Eubacteriales bacterium]|nr:nicotinate (nicotinamide) nucleotide adenylyltransferase [Eubacteriales bacterium]